MKNVVIGLAIGLMCLAGCAETTQSVYDPNAPELKYMLELTDPNWIEEVGVSRDSRVLFNVSVNRGMALKNQVILAEVAKRLMVMEESHIDPNELTGVCIRSDPNDPANPDNIDSSVCRECHK